MNTKLLHRLAWKEFRTLRALWLSLLAMALIFQLLLAWIVGHFGAPYQVLFVVAMWFPAFYSLACASMAFAGEREEGTDQLLSRLAVPPLALLSVKFVINVLSTAALLALLYPLTWIMGRWSLGQWFEDLDNWNVQGPLGTMPPGALASGVGFLSWGLFFSLLFRRVMPCLIATALATIAMPWVPSGLFGIGGSSERLGWVVRLGVVPAMPLLASVWLVQTWDENRWPRFVERLLEAWRRVTAKSERLTDSFRAAGQLSGGWRALVRPIGLCWPDERLPAWRREARRLLWLEWRQAWRVMLFVLAAFGVYVVCQGLFVAWGSQLIAKEFPFVVALVSFVFGAWSFQAQQSGQRFRDFAGHGASPTAMWFIKQVVWFAVTLLTVVLLTATTTSLSLGASAETLLGNLAYGFNWHEGGFWSRDPQLMRESLGGVVPNAVLAVGLCFAVGQLASLLMARAVTVATVGFVLAGLAFGWQQLTALAAVPSGLAVFPLVVGLLFASAVRMTDWLEERNSVRGWLRVIAACVVPSLVTLIGVPNYRIVEIPPVSSASGDANYYFPKLLNAATGDVPAVAKQTAQRWIRLAESLEDEPIFEWTNVVESPGSEGKTEIERVAGPRGLFDINSKRFAWDNLKNRDWLARHANLVVEAARVAQEADCAFDPEVFEGHMPVANFRYKRLSHLAVLLKIAAEAAIADGKLDEGLQHWLVLLRLSEHIQQHAPWESVQDGERLEIAVWSFLLRWVRHPAQTGDSLRAALGRPANATPHPLLKALKDHVELVPRKSNVVLEEYSIEKHDLEQYWREVRWPVSWMFWEREREKRLLDFSAAVALVEMGGYVPFPVSWQGEDQLVYHWGRARRERTYAAFLHRSTRSPNPYRHHWFVWTGYSSEWQRSNERGEAAAWRRGLIVTLALRAFHLDHGRWPSQWDELIGPYLDKLPVDPWTGLPFELRPQGYPFEIEMLGGRIPAHTPLFVSRGSHDQRLVPVVRPPTNGETSPTTDWVLTGSYGTQTWPPPEHGVSLSLIAFPLSATEP